MELYENCAELREEVARFMRRLYRKNLTTCSGGNISLRLDDSHILMTPSALDKGELTAEQVLLADMDGRSLTPGLSPTIEAGMHLAVLRRRPDVEAVVHAHPVFGTAFACLERPLDTSLTSEGYMLLPRLGMAGYATPGSEELAGFVADALSEADAALMRNHGVVTVGHSLLKAFDRLEAVETAARINVVAAAMGGGKGLDAERRLAIDAFLGRA